MYIVSYEGDFVYVVGKDVEMMDTLEPQYWNTAVLKGYMRALPASCIVPSLLNNLKTTQSTRTRNSEAEHSGHIGYNLPYTRRLTHVHHFYLHPIPRLTRFPD